MVRPELEARGLRVFEISAASHEGLRELTFAMAEVVSEREVDAPRPDGDPDRAAPEGRQRRGVHGQEVDGAWHVRGVKPQRWVQADRLQRTTRRWATSPTG